MMCLYTSGWGLCGMLDDPKLILNQQWFWTSNIMTLWWTLQHMWSNRFASGLLQGPCSIIEIRIPPHFSLYNGCWIQSWCFSELFASTFSRKGLFMFMVLGSLKSLWTWLVCMGKYCTGMTWQAVDALSLCMFCWSQSCTAIAMPSVESGDGI